MERYLMVKIQKASEDGNCLMNYVQVKISNPIHTKAYQCEFF